MKRKLENLILPLLCVIGLALLLYPQLSSLWNQRTGSRAISSYVESVSGLSDESYVREFSAAVEYNRELSRQGGYRLTEDMLEKYSRLLDVSGLGIMGYIEIPCIGVELPLYHGTDLAVLQIAVGHVEWSSLPTGGAGNHTVVCAHRGLPSATLFTELPDMQIGDVFSVHVLDETLTYEVDQIVTVDPDDMSRLRRVEGQDYFTLMTCTPYGINTHRLLVRGHRIENPEAANAAYIASEAAEIEPLIVAAVIAIPLLLLLLLPGSGINRKRR